jgi:site-specific DNA-methyltransferase (adenine-specific)
MVTDTDDTKLVPYFRDSFATIYLGDAIDVMAQLPDESIDLIFADPPYRLSNGGMSVQNGRQVSVNKGDWDRSSGIESDHAFNLAWLAECERLLTPNGTIWVSGTYHSIYSCGFAMQTLGFRILNEVSWFKPNASPNLGRRMFTASHESLIWASKSKKSKHVFHYDEMRSDSGEDDRFKNAGKQMRTVWEIDGDSDVWAIPTTPAREKSFGRHPTQKPLKLLERVIRSSSNPGDSVLDPFLGSGTTADVAIANGRIAIGIDSSKEFLDQIAVPRIVSRSAATSKQTPSIRS